MFAKISNSFINTSLLNQELRGDVAVSKFFSEKRNGGSAFFMLKNYSKVKEILLENIFTLPTPPSIFYAEFTGSGLVTPHIDAYNWTVALNCYINTSVDATIFYKKSMKMLNPLRALLDTTLMT